MAPGGPPLSILTFYLKFKDAIDVDETTVELRLSSSMNYRKSGPSLLRPVGGKIHRGPLGRNGGHRGPCISHITFQCLVLYITLTYLELKENGVKKLEFSAFSDLKLW